MKRILIILAALFATAQSQTIQTIGAPTTTVVSRGNFRTDSIFYLPKRQKLPTDSGAVRYQISDSSVYYWTGSQWRRLGVHIDTASMLNPYLRGSGTANYFPKFDASRSVINSKLYESGTNLLFNTTTASFTSSGISTIEANNTSASVFALKVLDTTRSYIASNSSNTMDINNLRAGDIRFYTNAQLRGRFQTDGTFRLNSLTGTGSRIVTADADGVLSATSSATGLVDTTVLSTRAWRQKGDDSLGAIIATKGSGTVTSVATGYGLSGGTITTTGTIIVDSAIVASRLRVGKVVDSLALVKQNVLTNPVTGTGTTNRVSKFTGTSTIGNSTIFDDGEVKINTTSDAGAYVLQTNGSIYTSGSAVSQMVLNTTNANGSANLYQQSGSTIGWLGNGSSSVIGGSTSDFGINSQSALFFAIGGYRAATINSNAETLLNTTTDAGDYKLQVSGNAYVTGTTVLAATSGNVGVGTASPSYKLHTNGTFDISNMIESTTSGVNSNATMRLKTATEGHWGIQTGNAVSSGLRFYDISANAERFRMHSNGGLRFIGQSAAPTAEAGTVYYDTDDNKLKVYNGTTWVDLH
jgi:hypothetical protein